MTSSTYLAESVVADKPRLAAAPLPEQSQPRLHCPHRYRDLGGIVRDDIDTFDASYDDGVVWMTKRRHAV